MARNTDPRPSTASIGIGNDTDPGAAKSGSNDRTATDGPYTPTALDTHSWLDVLKRIPKQGRADHLTTWAAALTFYGTLSIFPGLLVLVAALRLTGQATTHKVLNNVTTMAPGPARDVLSAAIQNLQRDQSSTAGALAIAGIIAAVWSASGYVGSFMQAANSIYDVPEGRPIWKKLPIRLGITVAVGLIVSASALMVVFTGSLAGRVGGLLGVGHTAVTIWGIAKWPVLVILISLLFALLYWAGPNARQGGFTWISPGSLLAVLIWIAASAGFALYVANFHSFNRMYGSLAAVIVFLVWLWITNLAILFGAEFNAEMQRARAVAAGHAPGDEPYMELRDTRTVNREQGGEDL